MKRFLLLLFALPVLAACNQAADSPAEKVITVSIEPLRYFTEAIAGDRFRVVTLVPHGSSPETYEPAPRQLVDLSESSAYLSVGGLGFEQTWMGKLAENVPQMPIVNLSKGIAPLRSDHGPGIDPHTWSSPKSAAIIAQNIYDVLCHLDSASAPYYQQRLQTLQTRIDSVDNAIRNTLGKSSVRTFLIYHPALGYLARDYGLTQLCLEEGGKEPTPARMRALIRQSREAGVTTLFVQQAFSEEGAKTLARETGARIVRINPLSYDWVKETLHTVNALKDGK